MTQRSLPYSQIARRSFLNRVGALVGTGLFAQIILPVWRYLFPGMSREPDKIVFTDQMLADLNATAPGDCFRFQWGAVPGLALLAQNGELRVFKGVCTHADCNVAWRPNWRDFFCACHEGRYDEFGKNVEGPPPRPLTQLYAMFEGSPNTKITTLTVWRNESVWQKRGENT